MRKIFSCLLFITLYFYGNSQFSFKEINTALAKEIVNENYRSFFQGINPSNKLSFEALKNSLEKEIKDSAASYAQKRLYIIKEDKSKDKSEKIEKLNKDLDSITNYKKDQIRQLVYWKKFYAFNEHTFFPAYFSSHSIAFFEGDTLHQKLFQNNAINYSPQTRKMILYTEAVNDYLGPVRVGIGFQIKSESKVDSLKTVDSTIKLEKKTDALSELQNGGGDISVNLKFPFIKNKNQHSLIQSKFYLYANTGFSLPILEKANEDFIFNYDFGIEGALYVRGFNNKLTFFGQFKAGYYNGNGNYKRIITDADKSDPTSFAMLQSSLGFDFMDGYRFRVDLFSGNNFVKKNFPATITFVVRPGKSKVSN